MTAEDDPAPEFRRQQLTAKRNGVAGRAEGMPGMWSTIRCRWAARPRKSLMYARSTTRK